MLVYLHESYGYVFEKKKKKCIISQSVIVNNSKWILYEPWLSTSFLERLVFEQRSKAKQLFLWFAKLIYNLFFDDKLFGTILQGTLEIK